ncbi:amino acid ABC transporter permease [Prochlorococcus marinus]|uniref:amino acid ABC transporter permease n=1 Tax=Prochlorococcus marinus TaxID=1219 RepID=UPI0022B2B3CD|nr:amino acid ABC transporter permease [Prochlorococcus marinus]
MRIRQKIIKELRRLIFSNLFDKIITVTIILGGSFSLILGFNWIFTSADWSVILQNFPLFLYGSFPVEQRWRPALWILFIVIITLATLLDSRWLWLRKILPFAWFSITPLGIYLLSGGFGLLHVESRYWGGLTLTILLTATSSLFSLPLGILLALGRQSKLPIIKKVSSVYIDSMRSVPLIAVLFFGQLLIPLFLPVGLEISRVWRAVLAFTLFVSAYIAEDIRGGLQSIPKTQFEAGKALGLNQYQITSYIILPQAIQVALPALTNQAIGLLQNTSLMAILGLVELLGIGRSLLANPQFIGHYIEVYIWLALVYWIVCTIMALLARHIELNMSTNRSNL